MTIVITLAPRKFLEAATDGHFCHFLEPNKLNRGDGGGVVRSYFSTNPTLKNPLKNPLVL